MAIKIQKEAVNEALAASRSLRTEVTARFRFSGPWVSGRMARSDGVLLKQPGAAACPSGDRGIPVRGCVMLC